MDITLEVRWFVPGAVPDAVADWFDDVGAERESERTDLYLVSSDPTLNVKLREGKLQTKHRIGGPSPTRWGESLAGERERWVKWSFELDDDAPDLFDDDPTGLWVPVHKRRDQLELDDDDQHARLNGTMTTTNPADAALELTRVEAAGHEAWTVCVETEGPPQALEATLQQVSRHLFAGGFPHPLPTEQSMGYVGWLTTLPGDVGAPREAFAEEFRSLWWVAG